VYELDDLRALKPQTEFFPPLPEPAKAKPSHVLNDQRSAKRLISRLHSVLRDSDGNSNLLERFDELTKLLFLKLNGEQTEPRLFAFRENETIKSYADRIRAAYQNCIGALTHLFPSQYRSLISSDDAIRTCGIVLDEVSFKGASFDLKGLAYEEVIRGTFDKSDNQQFFTPPQIVHFMVEMVRPYIKGVVADPACGTAGFLTQVVRLGIPVKQLLGFEIDERLAWVSTINLELHGAKNFQVAVLGKGGTLGPGADKFKGTCDTILTNPPFGSDLSDVELLGSYTLGQGRSSRRRGILFIERCHALLKPSGILAIIIDEGVLNSSTATDVRKYILERFEILSVTALPETAFMPYATVNASILVLRKTKCTPAAHSTFFAKADQIGRKPNGDEDIIYGSDGAPQMNSDLPRILEKWHNHLSGHTTPPSEEVFTAQIAANLRDDETLRIDFRYHHPSRFRSQALIKACKYRLLSLAELCDERNDTIVPSTEMPDQMLLYTGLANIESLNGIAHQVQTPTASIKSAVKRYYPDDILFARMRPNLRKVAHMTGTEPGYASPECSVLTVRKNSDGEAIFPPDLLAAMLRSDFVFGQILHLVAGIGRPRLSPTDLRRVQIPIPPKNIQETGRATFIAQTRISHELKGKANALMVESVSTERRAADELAAIMTSGSSSI
jgi:tRNA1(Val) A37 N6-methylase TrmN6